MFSDIDGFPIWIRTLLPDPAPEGGVDYLIFPVTEVPGDVDLVGEPISSGVPDLGSPALQVIFALSGTAIDAGVPTLSSPDLVIQITYSFSAPELISGVPDLGSPSLSAIFSLSAAELISGVPSLSSPAIAFSYSFSGQEIVPGVPALSSPALSMIISLLGDAIASGFPSLSSPELIIIETYSFSGDPIVSGVPTLASIELIIWPPEEWEGEEYLINTGLNESFTFESELNDFIELLSRGVDIDTGTFVALSYIQSEIPSRSLLSDIVDERSDHLCLVNFTSDSQSTLRLRCSLTE